MIDRLRFDNKLESLIDTQGKRYNGRRFKTIHTGYIPGSHSSIGSAEYAALMELEDLGNKEEADAYEVISLQVHDSRLECDSNPYTASGTAFLYKKEKRK